MNLISIASLVVLCAMATAADSERKHYDASEAESLFEQFVKDFNRNYKDDADRKEHFDAFKNNLAKINEMNEKNPSAIFGINKFADYTEAERSQMFGIRKQQN